MTPSTPGADRPAPRGHHGPGAPGARAATLLILACLAALVGALPLLGVALAGGELAPYLEFPPRTAAGHASFSWPVFCALAAMIVTGLAPLVLRVWRAGDAPAAPAGPVRGFPCWGFAGLGLLAVSWLLAWTRFDWFAPLQRHTFAPIWLGYIVAVNALTWRRTGTCLLTGNPRRLATLFPLSAAFWWLFEYLNRFVGNWHYVGVSQLDGWQYFWQATLPFSTVLPAVLSTRDWLGSHPRAYAGLHDAWHVRVPAPRALAAAAVAASAAALTGIGAWPRLLYPAVWVAPLVVLLGLQVILGRRTVLAPLARGDWRGPWLAALAALACGFLWELWNVHSLAHWEYAIPHVHRFRIFEMPLLGYAGYLPFGLECLAVAALVGDPGGPGSPPGPSGPRREPSTP